MNRVLGGRSYERLRPRPLTTRPTVTVVIPCYKYGHFLPAAVDSALSQPDVDVDVIVVDDASPDGSGAIAQHLAEADSRVQAVIHDVNQGHIATYNDGLALARGDYVVLLSADDLLTDGQLTRATALMQARPDVGLVYGNPVRFTDARPPARTHATSWSIWSGERWIKRICRRGQNLIFTPEAVMRTSLMRDLVGYDKRLPSAADFHLWLRAASKMNVGRVNGCDQGYYREHGANMHFTEYAGLLIDTTERIKTFDLFFAEDGRTLTGAAELEARAKRSLASECRRLGREELDSGGSDQELFASFMALAAELAIGSRESRQDAQRVARALAGREPAAAQRIASAGRNLQARLRWQRWYRLGT